MTSDVGGGISISDSLAGDVVFATTSGELVIRREQEEWRKDEEPVGIVVIPASHNVYSNGACGVMALMNASALTPNIGSISNEEMYWGYWQNDIYELTNYKGITEYGNNDTWTGINFHEGYGYLPSDQSDFGAKLMNKIPDSDQKCWYYYNDNAYHAPSPYLNDGTINSNYHTPWRYNDGNALSDIKGKENTAVLISYAAAQSDWKTSPSITNNREYGYYPAACACWRYSTTGTKQGDWYLPAMGELGYVCVRFKKINDTISALQSYFGKTFCLLNMSNNYWASSEYDYSKVWYVYLGNGCVGDLGNKYYEYCTRPFMQLKPKIKYEFLDLGLSVDWCTRNIGAFKSEENGYYFMWGDTKAYDKNRFPIDGGTAISFDWFNYPLCNGSNDTLTKYNDIDGKEILDEEDDAAHVHMGGNWRMPTSEEFQELLNACDVTWTSDSDHNIYGWLFILKSDPSKTLFFPQSGYYYDTILTTGNRGGPVSIYWAKSTYDIIDSDGYASALNLQNTSGFISSYTRMYGCNIRAVKPKK